VSNLPDAVHENDLVLGHGDSHDRDEVVLGGFDAIRSCYGSIDPLIRIDALKEAPKHGHQGLQLLHLALQDPEIDVRLAAYRFARLMHPQKQPPCDYRKLFKTMDSWNWDASNPEVQILKEKIGFLNRGVTGGTETINWPIQNINYLLERKDQPGFQRLKAIFLGDDLEAEPDLYTLYKKSYLCMANFAPILTAFPELEMLHICGKFGDCDSHFALSPLHHSRLQSLVIETAAQSHNVLTALQTAELPELQYLELWLGRCLGIPEYYYLSLFEDIVSGRLFPKLRYLGLRSSEVSHIILESLEQFDHNSSLSVLDLSLGAFHVSELKRILENSVLHRLDVLDLHNISFYSGRFFMFQQRAQEDTSNSSKERLLELIQNHPAHIVHGTTCLDLLEKLADSEDIDSRILHECESQPLSNLEEIRYSALYE
jgi:hypothetical protein